eukprot:scaffold69171_cov16-Tisochrysis_lutea.AAC.1
MCGTATVWCGYKFDLQRSEDQRQSFQLTQMPPQTHKGCHHQGAPWPKESIQTDRCNETCEREGEPADDPGPPRLRLWPDK